VFETIITEIQDESKVKLTPMLPIIAAFLSALAAISAVVIAYKTVRINIENAEEQKLDRRAYVIPLQPKIGYGVVSARGQLAFHPSLRNDGKNPAGDVEVHLNIFGIENDAVTKYFDHKFTVTNKLSPSIEPPWVVRIRELEEYEHFPTSFVSLKIDYKDEILGKHYDEKFFYIWYGILNKDTQNPSLEYVSENEITKVFKNPVLEYISENEVKGIDFIKSHLSSIKNSNDDSGKLTNDK